MLQPAIVQTGDFGGKGLILLGDSAAVAPLLNAPTLLTWSKESQREAKPLLYNQFPFPLLRVSRADASATGQYLAKILPKGVLV